MVKNTITSPILTKVADRTTELSSKYSEADVLNDKEAARWIRWDWSIGVAFYGLGKTYDLTKNEKYITKMKQWIDERIETEPKTVCVNTNALLTTILRLDQLFHDTKYHDLFDKFDRYLFEKAPRVPCNAIAHTVVGKDYTGEVWADTLFMSIIYLVQRGLTLQNEKYIQEAINQLVLHINCLFDPKTGLFYHGWDDNGKKPLGVKWGRGNSWITASTVEIVSAIPFDFPEKQVILERLDQQLAALGKLQDETGLWRTVLDNPDTYLETSVTAGVIYGTLKGIRLGLVHQEHAQMADRAFTGLLAKIDNTGNVTGGSSGTPIKADSLEYNKIPLAITPFTQGLALMALSEMLLSTTNKID